MIIELEAQNNEEATNAELATQLISNDSEEENAELEEEDAKLT